MLKKIIIITIIFAVFSILFFFYYLNNLNKPASQLKPLTIGNKKIFVEIADTDQKRKEGLSNRNKLEENQGMLFVFNQPGKYTFWMKDMLFPLDFIFIKDNKIVNIAENIPNPKNKNDTPVIISQKEEFDTVLEVNAGFIRKNHIKIGDLIERW